MTTRRREQTDDAKERRAQWMERVQAGDHDAYRALLEDVSAELRGFLRRRLRDAQEVEDVVQEILLTVHRARHTYDPSRPFEPWLMAIARHAAVDAFRRERRRGRWERLAEDDTPVEGSTEDRAGELSIAAAFARLPDQQREALEMVKLEGLSVEEAAARSGVSEGALRVRIHRGYRALRARLLGENEDER
jgi:RNA polymerase sigma-70 factor (ECF subfamily)